MENRYESYHCVEVYENITDKLRQLKLDLSDLRNNVDTLRYIYSKSNEEGPTLSDTPTNILEENIIVKGEELILPYMFETTLEEKIKSVKTFIKLMKRRYRKKAYQNTFSRSDWEVIKSIDLEINVFRANLRFMEAVVNERIEGSCIGISTSVLEGISEGTVGRQKIYQAADAVAQYFFSILDMEWKGACCFTMESNYSILPETQIVTLPPFAESRTRFWILIAHEACHEKIVHAVRESLKEKSSGILEFIKLILELESFFYDFLPISNMKRKFFDIGIEKLETRRFDQDMIENCSYEFNELQECIGDPLELHVFKSVGGLFPILEILVDILTSEITGIAYFSSMLCYGLHPYHPTCESSPPSILRGIAIINTLKYIGVLENAYIDDNLYIRQNGSPDNGDETDFKNDEIDECLFQAWNSYLRIQTDKYPDSIKEWMRGKINWKSVIERLNQIVFPENGKTKIEQKENYPEFNKKVNRFLEEYMIPRKLPQSDVITEFDPAIILNAVWRLRVKRSIAKLNSKGKNDVFPMNPYSLEIKGTHLAIFSLYKWYYQTNGRWKNV